MRDLLKAAIAEVINDPIGSLFCVAAFVITTAFVARITIDIVTGGAA